MRTYGTATLDRAANQWVLHVEPHVVMRLKRTFGKIDTRQSKRITISATPENSRELLWFTQRFPLEVTPRTEMESRAQAHVEKELRFADLLAGRCDVEIKPLKRPARDYQNLAAVAWRTSGSLLLGDEVGTGKTTSGIAGINDPSMLPALVVTLTHLPKQWQAEINTVADLSTHILRKTIPYDITKDHDGVFPDVVITSYSKLAGWREILADGKLFKSVIFDEVHELRKTGSQKYAAAQHIIEEVPQALGMSATPIFNYGDEIWNILDCLKKDCLGTKDEFIREWCTNAGMNKYKVTDPAALGLFLREAGLFLRRTRKDIGRELPPLSIIPHYIAADEKVIEDAMHTKETFSLAKMILSQEAEEFRGQRMQAAGEFDMRMREATGIAKAGYAADFIRMLHEDSGKKVVVFAWHHKVHAILKKKLADLKPVFYTGDESIPQKEASRKAFVEGDAQIIVISLRAGAGLDGLQYVTNIGVAVELDWSPAVMIQNMGRLDRDGQPESVLFYYLLSEVGSDPVMSDVIGVKRQQLEGINTPQGDLIETLQVDPDHVKKLAQRYLETHKDKL